MPVVIVNQPTDLAGLTDRLLRANSSSATRQAAARALREANPGLDLAALQPGTAVVVPPLHGGLTRIGDVVEPGLGAAAERVDRQLAGLVDALAAGEQRGAAARERATAALADPAVKRAVRDDQAHEAVAAALREHVAEDEAAAERRTELAATATAAWSQDMAELRQLWTAED